MFSNLNKWERRIFAVALVCCLLFLFLLTDDSFFDWDSNSANLKTVGQVTESTNDVRHKITKQFLWKKAKTKTLVHAGDSMFTGKGSESRVRLIDGSEMVVRENSLVVFENIDGDMEMKFNFGSIFGFTGSSKLKLQDCGNTYEISGEQGQFEIQKDGGCKGARLKVYGGKVSVNGKVLGKDQNVALNKGLKEISNKPRVRAPAQTLSGAPRVYSPKRDYVHKIQNDRFGKPMGARNFKIKWVSEVKKPAYEFEIANDPNFENVIGRYSIKVGELNTPIMPTGQYFARVRETTKKTPWSSVFPFQVSLLEYDPNLAAPKLLTPRINYRAIGDKVPEFKWSDVKNADHYAFELSSTREFTTTQKLDLKKTTYMWPSFASGQFYFRVAALAKSGTKSRYSEIGEIKVAVNRPVLEPVADLRIRGKSPDDPGDPQEVKLKWSKMPNADKYIVELSKDGSFKQPIRLESRTPASLMTVPAPGDYKWRVKPVDKAGRAITSYSDLGQIKYDLNVPLSSPKLMEPAQNMTMYFQKSGTRVFWMEWNPVRQADAYILEIAKDADFKNVLMTEKMKKTRILVQRSMPQGKLYWRVKAEGDGGQKTSNWSEVRRMRVFSGKSAKVFEKED